MVVLILGATETSVRVPIYRLHAGGRSINNQNLELWYMDCGGRILGACQMRTIQGETGNAWTTVMSRSDNPVDE